MMEVRRCVADCPADMRVDVESGIPIDAETVAELRCLPSWPSGVLIEVHRDPTSVSVVEIALKNWGDQNIGLFGRASVSVSAAT